MVGSSVSSNRAIAQLFYRYRSAAKNRGLHFLLRPEEFIELVKSRCYYCGVAPLQVCRRAGDWCTYNGIDRVRNREGYIPGNVVACCARCNDWKRAMTVADFLGHVARIAKNLIVHRG